MRKCESHKEKAISCSIQRKYCVGNYNIPSQMIINHLHSFYICEKGFEFSCVSIDFEVNPDCYWTRYKSLLHLDLNQSRKNFLLYIYRIFVLYESKYSDCTYHNRSCNHKKIFIFFLYLAVYMTYYGSKYSNYTTRQLLCLTSLTALAVIKRRHAAASLAR